MSLKWEKKYKYIINYKKYENWQGQIIYFNVMILRVAMLDLHLANTEFLFSYKSFDKSHSA